MSRKFFFCFPLRTGNIVFGYILIIISIAVVAFNLYMLGLSIVPEEQYENDKKFDNWENLEQIFGHRKNTLVAIITMLYYISYIVIGFLLLVFSTMLLVGAFKANGCLVSTFFTYSFLHLFLTVGLVVWEATSAGYIQLGLILASDVLMLCCLFGVRYLIEAIHSGHIYSQPGEVLFRY